jgi:hypothetical protein
MNIPKQTQALLDLTNASRWHDDGIDGSYGATIMTELVADRTAPELGGKVIDSGGPNLVDRDGHGFKCALVHHVFAPGRSFTVILT